jgi:hypothetical protein
MREAPSRAAIDDEDEQLARCVVFVFPTYPREADGRAIAESVRESRNPSRQGSARDSPIPVLDDDEDEELRQAIAMSEEESRAPKRQRRESTPDEERRMIEEYVMTRPRHVVWDPPLTAERWQHRWQQTRSKRHYTRMTTPRSTLPTERFRPPDRLTVKRNWHADKRERDHQPQLKLDRQGRPARSPRVHPLLVARSHLDRACIKKAYWARR